MLEELKRCNSIGNREGILFLIAKISNNTSLKKEKIRNQCVFETGVDLKFPGAFLFLEYLRLINIEEEYITITDEFKRLVKGQPPNHIIRVLVCKCVNTLIEQGVFDSNDIPFDIAHNQFIIKNSLFLLKFCSIRNFLITMGALKLADNGIYVIEKEYEKEWVGGLAERKRKVTLEHLRIQQEAQVRRGSEAEDYILDLERKRIPRRAKEIKRISDIDVAAGYDIVSFEKEDSPSFDRFIEVKCYIGKPHFYWSENEIDMAKLKGEQYILCLVAYDRMGDFDYKPMIVANPYKFFFESKEWMINISSYKIEKV